MMLGMLPRGPRGMPILGMLPAVRRDPTGVFLKAARRFGDVAYFKIGPRRGYLITNPADIRHVLQDNARNYHKSPLYQKLRMSIGNGLLTSEGDFWLRQRRIAQPAFHRQKIAGLAGVMAQAARETADEWQTIAANGRAVDVSEEMMRFTRTVVLRALLGADLGPFAAKVDEAWVVINQQVGESFWSLGIAERFQRAKARRFEAARAMLRDAVDYVITARRRHPSDSADLLSMLLAARDEETGEGMTDEQLRVEVTTFLLAGQETTSLALTWTWYLLSQHAAARQRLEDEIDTVLNGRPPDTPISRTSRTRAWWLMKPCGSTRRPGASHGRRWQTTPWAGTVCRVDGSRLSSRTCCIACRRTGRIRRPSIPNASLRSRAPIDQSSCTCRSVPGHANVSAISSR